MRLKKQLSEIMERIIAKVDPDQIYLFGSFARGDQHRGSSIDLLIVGVSSLKFFDRLRLILKLKEDVNFRPLYYTPQEMELLKKKNDGYMQSILSEAILLYSKKPKT